MQGAVSEPAHSCLTTHCCLSENCADHWCASRHAHQTRSTSALQRAFALLSPKAPLPGVTFVPVIATFCSQITDVLHNMRPEGKVRQPFKEPSHCPSCSSPLVFCPPAGAGAKGTLRCENAVCPAQQLQKQVMVGSCALVSCVLGKGMES